MDKIVDRRFETLEHDGTMLTFKSNRWVYVYVYYINDYGCSPTYDVSVEMWDTNPNDGEASAMTIEYFSTGCKQEAKKKVKKLLRDIRLGTGEYMRIREEYFPEQIKKNNL